MCVCEPPVESIFAVAPSKLVEALVLEAWLAGVLLQIFLESIMLKSYRAICLSPSGSEVLSGLCIQLCTPVGISLLVSFLFYPR